MLLKYSNKDIVRLLELVLDCFENMDSPTGLCGTMMSVQHGLCPEKYRITVNDHMVLDNLIKSHKPRLTLYRRLFIVRNNGYWWRMGYKRPRIKFLKKLITHYKNQHLKSLKPMSKSFTTLQQEVCRVTGKPYDTGALLLDKRMREKFEMHTITGWGFSPEVIEKFEQDYIALVEIDFAKSNKDKKGQVTPEGAYRLGRIAYIKRKVLQEIVPTIEVKYMSWAEPDFLDYLESIKPESDE